MRVIALEEHVKIATLAAEIPVDAQIARGYPASSTSPSPNSDLDTRLFDAGDARRADMAAAGISLQVLSWVGAGADLLSADAGPVWSRRVNDALCDIVASHPEQFAGFAHLPVTNPQQAAHELTRCVQDLGLVGAMINGTTDGKFLDDPEFEPVLARAEELDVPIYLHPNLPPPAVMQAYYTGLSPDLGRLLASSCYGWHAETAVHILRLVFSGTFERHPKLKIIVGHMGEMLPMMLARATEKSTAALRQRNLRPLDEQLRAHIYVTTSGQFTSPPFEVLLAVFGIDRIMFSIDYPYSTNAEGRAFLDSLNLPPDEMTKLVSGNAERLLKLDRRPQPN